MRLATFSTEGRIPRVGVELDGEIADLTACDDGPLTLKSVLQQDGWASDVALMIKRAPRVATGEATLHAPVPATAM